MKKYIKIIICSIFILLTINTTNIISSNSKYYKKENALDFDTKLISLNQNNNLSIDLNHTTYDTLKVVTTFERNNIVLDDSNDSYTVDITSIKEESNKSLCKYKMIVHDLSGQEIKSSSTKDITLNEPSTDSYDKKSTQNITVYIECPLDIVTTTLEDGIQYVILDLKITEQVNDEDSFIYQDSSLSYFKIPLKDYHKEYPIPESELVFTIPKDKNLYDNIIKWLTPNYLPYTDYYYEIQEYLKDNINDSEFIGEIKGLTISEENNQYNIKINPDFEGYARTYYSQKTDSKRSIYFSSSDEESLYNAFEYYLKNYFYPDNEKDNQKIEIILKFIKSIGMENIINQKVSVNGIYISSLNKGLYMIYIEELYNTAFATIDPNGKASEEISTYLTSKYSTISENLKNKIINKDGEIIESVIKHQEDSNLANDYYPILDNNIYNIITVTSNKEEPIIIKQLEGISKDINLEFNNTNDNLNIELSINVPENTQKSSKPEMDLPTESDTPPVPEKDNLEDNNGTDNDSNNEAIPNEEITSENISLESENIIMENESEESNPNESITDNNEQKEIEDEEEPEVPIEGEKKEEIPQNQDPEQEEKPPVDENPEIPTEPAEEYTEYKEKLSQAASILKTYFRISDSNDSITKNGNTLTLNITITKSNIKINNTIIYKKEDY